MKRIQLMALGALLSLAGQIAYPYAMVNDKDSESTAIAYVFRDRDQYKQYLQRLGVPDTVIAAADKVGASVGVVGAALAIPTEGVSLLAEGVPLGVQAAKVINEALKKAGLMDKAMQLASGVIAVHKDIVPGNKGRGAEFNSGDIQNEFGIPQGSTLYVVITDKANGEPLLQTELASNGILGFIIKKDATTGKLTAQLSSAAASQYEQSTIQSPIRTWWDKVVDTAKEAYEEFVK